MNKYKIRNLAATFLCTISLLGVAGIISVVKAQTSIEGGDSFDSAVEIEAGSYQGGSLEHGEMEYFYVTGIKPGQEVSIKGTFAPASTTYGAFAILSLYSENYEELIEDYEAIYESEGSLTISWLSNAEEDMYKYYIKAGSDTWDIDSYSLDISVTDRYDAETNTDAGDSFEKAKSISSGTFTGYLSGESGTDTEDVYKVEIKKGKTLTAEVTPSREAQPELYIYDSDREEIATEYASNPGAIVQASFTAEKDDYVFVVVMCDMWCSSDIVDYSLKISGGETPDAGVVQEDDNDTTTVTTTKEGTNWGLILGVVAAIAIIIVVIIVIVVFTFIKSKSSKKEKSTKTENNVEKEGEMEKKEGIQSEG